MIHIKTLIFVLLSAALILSSCASNQEKTPEIPPEISEIKDNFTSLYYVMFRKDNKHIFPAMLTEVETVMASTEFSFSGTEESQAVGFFDEQTHYYTKELLKLMDEVRTKLLTDGVSQETVSQLDDSIHRLTHELNEEDYTMAMRSISNGIYLIARLLDDYEMDCMGCVLRLEYCLNLLELEADTPSAFSRTLALTEQVISELNSQIDDEAKMYVKQMQESISSLREASQYHDAKLIRLKVEIMRNNWKKISQEAKKIE